MNPDDFFVAKRMEEDGWEYLGIADSGDMMFSKMFCGVTYVADVREDR